MSKIITKKSKNNKNTINKSKKEREIKREWQQRPLKKENNHK